ncbi:hypothetical protein E2C01_102157 [Portunus trituberculatus]|uniref:Uncharacterized protein n=1 Tax=Portunus trituberculatus TaxID=210409 RepID=A0A5B7KGL9_PORTR|nr:hypothetical protein [Portunus trituberculatus]
MRWPGIVKLGRLRFSLGHLELMENCESDAHKCFRIWTYAVYWEVTGVVGAPLWGVGFTWLAFWRATDVMDT